MLDADVPRGVIEFAAAGSTPVRSLVDLCSRPVEPAESD
jgi:hypothetical protein